MAYKLLIANRGEIACRIIRTCKKMGIKTVAVYSSADINSLFVKMADESYNIGEAPSKKSYLNIDKILEVIKMSGADMVHPGYGFLSENAAFATALEENGVIFVGPSKMSVHMMGDKIESKKTAIEAKVSTVPGHMGIIKDYKEAVKIAKKIGFPVMIKASSGGGGKGMRVVYKESEIQTAFDSASNEARNSFSDDRIFIEKYIEKPRHIEIQVIGDKFGNIVCLGERECSIQRNNQKVIEEAPSPFLDEATRKKMYSHAKALAKKVGYYSAGTVEFIVDREKNFYFLEMNTRLQVEHPVTELVTGLDIVELMIKIALGEKLPFTQDDIKLNGWAMESRICSEDPSRNFLPSSGRIYRYSEPQQNKNVRVDSGVFEGGEVSMFYDSMIAKLCSYGKTRNEAITHMKTALSNFYIEGVSHNINFLETIMDKKKFVDGDISTNFIREEFPEGFSGRELTQDQLVAPMSAAVFIYLKNFERNAKISGQLPNMEKQINDRWIATINNHDKFLVTDVTKIDDDTYKMTIDKVEFTLKSLWTNGARLFTGALNKKNISVRIKDNNLTGNYLLQYKGSDIFVSVQSPRVSELSKFMPKTSNNVKYEKLISPITGKVSKIFVKDGDEIKDGQDLIIVEAMKMENIIRSEIATRVKKVNFKEGDSVNSGDVIIDFEN